MAIVQFARFKSDKPEEMVKAAKQGKAIFEKRRRISSAIPVSHRRVGRRVAHHHALLELGSLWKGAGGSGEGRGIREADGTYNYLCRTKGPQHRRRHRSLTTAKETAPARGES